MFALPKGFFFSPPEHKFDMKLVGCSKMQYITWNLEIILLIHRWFTSFFGGRQKLLFSSSLEQQLMGENRSLHLTQNCSEIKMHNQWCKDVYQDVFKHMRYFKTFYICTSSADVFECLFQQTELCHESCLFCCLSLTKASNTNVSKVSLSEFSIMMLKRASRVSCRN